MAPSDSALCWEGLSLDIAGQSILRDIHLSVAPGETLALVGESGSGKTLCCMAALGLLPDAASLTSGRILGLGQCWASSDPEAALTAIPRGDRITMVFQEPMTSLNPTMRCGIQLVEVIQRHRLLDRDQATARAESLLEEVQMPDVGRAFSAYPHGLSGGQKQRVLIAMALANDPDTLSFAEIAAKAWKYFFVTSAFAWDTCVSSASTATNVSFSLSLALSVIPTLSLRYLSTSVVTSSTAIILSTA